MNVHDNFIVSFFFFPHDHSCNFHVNNNLKDSLVRYVTVLCIKAMPKENISFVKVKDYRAGLFLTFYANFQNR